MLQYLFLTFSILIFLNYPVVLADKICDHDKLQVFDQLQVIDNRCQEEDIHRK